MKVEIQRLDKTLPLPKYQTAGSVAFDIYCRLNAKISPGIAKALPSNLVMRVPKGHVLILSARSSLYKKGLMMANGIGIIDQDYCGPKDEIGILLYNFTSKPVEIKRGERIAQGLIVPVAKAQWSERRKLKNKSRGGFGSTG